MESDLLKLREALKGELFLDDLYKSIYATDASVYREKPMGVCYPEDLSDLKKIILFAREHKIGIIPRTAGTSLAGQCVG
ncbi:MAG: hypothetical protein WCD31_09955, partial [Gillisia sp.]